MKDDPYAQAAFECLSATGICSEVIGHILACGVNSVMWRILENDRAGCVGSLTKKEFTAARKKAKELGCSLDSLGNFIIS